MHWALMNVRDAMCHWLRSSSCQTFKWPHLHFNPHFNLHFKLPHRHEDQLRSILGIGLPSNCDEISRGETAGCHWSLPPAWKDCLQISASSLPTYGSTDRIKEQALLKPYGESQSAIFLNLVGPSWLFSTLPDSMDASHFTESSVLLSCFFKQPSTCSQSQAHGTDSTVVITQIKPN